MSENTIFVGVGAGIVGLLLGYVIGGPDSDDLVKKFSRQVSTSAAETSAAGAEQMAAMDARIGELEQALAASQEGMGTKLDEAVSSLSARMDTMTADLGNAVAESGSAQAEQVQATLSAGIETLQGSISDISVAALAAVAVEDEAESETTAAAPVPVEIDGAKVGQTEIMMDGAVRVFVSGINRDDKTARVAVNGLSMQTVGSYHNAEFMLGSKTCNLLLDDIVEGHVQMSTKCEE